MTALEAIPLARKLIAEATRYPGGRDLERLRELADGELRDLETEDTVLAAAVREAAWNELYEDRA